MQVEVRSEGRGRRPISPPGELRRSRPPLRMTRSDEEGVSCAHLPAEPNASSRRDARPPEPARRVGACDVPTQLASGSTVARVQVASLVLLKRRAEVGRGGARESVRRARSLRSIASRCGLLRELCSSVWPLPASSDQPTHVRRRPHQQRQPEPSIPALASLSLSLALAFAPLLPKSSDYRLSGNLVPSPLSTHPPPGRPPGRQRARAPMASPSVSKARDHLISGGASGLASSVALQPLDLLKTRIQQEGGTSKSAAPFASPIATFPSSPGLTNFELPSPPPSFPRPCPSTCASRFASCTGSHARRKVWDVTRGVVADNGVLGLWRGTAPTILRCVVGSPATRSPQVALPADTSVACALARD